MGAVSTLLDTFDVVLKCILLYFKILLFQNLYEKQFGI